MSTLTSEAEEEFRQDLLDGTDKSLNYDNASSDDEEQSESSDDETNDEIIKQMKLGRKAELRAFVVKRKTGHVRSLLIGYFNQLKKRLPLPGLTYLNLMEFGEEDFGVFGKRLEDYLGKCGKILDKENIVEFQNLLKQYFEFIPNDLLQLRQRLLTIYDQLEDEPNLKCPIDDYRMVTYKEIDRKKLSMQTVQTRIAQQQIDYFIRQIRLSEESKGNLDRLIAFLNEAIQNSSLAELRPKLYAFGSYLTGIAAYDCDLDIVIKFEAFDSLDLLDYETSWLALSVIQRVLERKLGFDMDCSLVPSRRCPIINLDFGICLDEKVIDEVVKLNETLEENEQIIFKEIDISIRSLYSYNNSKLIHFLAKYDHRFYEMNMILKYWAKEKICLIGPGGISSYALSLMIVFFLQNTEPRVLPPIKELQDIARKYPDKYPPIKIHEYNFEFCDDLSMIEKNANTKSTSELLFEFFRFYGSFYYETQAICPRTGERTPKEEIHKHTRYAEQQSDISSLFRMSSVTIQDPFVDSNNAGAGFQKYQLQTWRQALGNIIPFAKQRPDNCLWFLIKVKGQTLPWSKVCSNPHSRKRF